MAYPPRQSPAPRATARSNGTSKLPMHEPRLYPMKVVADRTGLTPHVIRIWEKRYRVVSPVRTDTNRRLYSEEDLERLLLLRRITTSGYSIGHVAELPTERLRELAREEAQRRAGGNGETPPGDTARPPAAHPEDLVDAGVEEVTAPSPEAYVEQCLECARKLEAHCLERLFHRAAVDHSQPILIERIIMPLMMRIGEEWRAGTMRVAHEHLAASVVRTFLGALRARAVPHESDPCIVVATPAGQLHELGALVVANTATTLGWHVLYLGANLPAHEIAAAVRQRRARAVALSIVYPGDDPQLAGELARLQDLLRDVPNLVVFVGGRCARCYGPAAEAAGAIRLDSLADLREHLERLRNA